MSRFFVPTENISENTIIINGSDVNHIKNVLRYHCGDKLSVSDSSGIEYKCTIDSMTDTEIVLVIDDKEISDSELGIKLVLFQGLPKSDKMELIIQKAVELGATDIYPVINERSVVRLDDKKARQKTERWQKISESAAKQSGRMVIPQIHLPVSFHDAMSIAVELDSVLLPYENADGMVYSGQCISDAVRKNSIGIFIGPEGGFSKNEVSLAKSAGTKIISLGKRILRTETAGLTTLSIIMFEIEKLRGSDGSIS